MPGLDKKTLAELQADFVRLGNELSVLAEQRREIDIEIRSRITRVAARLRLAALDKNEKDTLKEVLKET